MVVILICADLEWESFIQSYYYYPLLHKSNLGEWFEDEILQQKLVFFHAGWGKIHSASSTQYCIDRWHPDLIINIGTCGGIQGKCKNGDLILASRTIVYDIHEQMGSAEDAIRFYTTDFDSNWLKVIESPTIIKGTIVSGDRDLIASEMYCLTSRYNALAADWESGSIAFVAKRNAVPCMILRGVSDVVDKSGSPAYGNIAYFMKGTEQVMNKCLAVLPQLIEAGVKFNHREERGV